MIRSKWRVVDWAWCSLLAGFLSASLAWAGPDPEEDPIQGIMLEWRETWRAMPSEDEKVAPGKLEPGLKRLEGTFQRFQQWQKHNPDFIYRSDQQSRTFELANFRMGELWLRAGNVGKAISHLKAEIALGGYLHNTRNPLYFARDAFSFHAAILAAGGEILSIPGSGYQVFPVPADEGKPSYVFAHHSDELTHHGINIGGAEKDDMRLLMYLFTPDEAGVYHASSQAEILSTKGRATIDCRMEHGHRILVLKGVEKIVAYRGGELDGAVATTIKRSTLELKAKGKFLEQPAAALARTGVPAGQR